MASKKRHWQRPLGVSRSDTRFSESRNETLEGQGSIDYLLLIAGAVLVVTVVLLLLFTSIIPAAGQILSNNISQAGQSQTLPGNNPNNPPPAYSGPLVMDWSNVPSITYASFGIDNSVDPPTLTPAPSIQLFSQIELKNTGTAPLVINRFIPTFSFSNHPSASIDSLILSNGAGGFFSFSTISSGSTVVFPSDWTINPNESWTMTLRFDVDRFSVAGSTYLLPQESAHSISFSFVDSSSTTHLPDSFREFLVYEKKILAGGSLDSFIQTCDGSLGASTNPSHGVITDWLFGQLYSRDLGYSTVFSFPAEIPSTATVLDARFFMTQLGAIANGAGASSADSDPYHVVKDTVSCNPLIFDDDEEGSSTYPNEVKTILPSDLGNQTNDVKDFDFGGIVLPSEDEIFFTLVGEDSPSVSYTQPSEGWRQWQTGFNPGQSTPTPFLVVRYTVPQ